MKEWSALKKLIYLHAAVLGGSGTEEKTVSSSTSPFSLVDAVAHAIISLTQTGKCDQASTPTPTSPVPIKCNNGTLGMVDRDLPSGYKRVLGYSCDNNSMWEITDFHLRGSDTIRISFAATAACNVFGCYQGTEATDNYDLYVSTTSGSKYLRYGSGTYLSYWSAANLGQRFDVVFTPTGTQGMPEDSTWTAKTFTSANDLLIGSTTTSGTSSKLKGNLYGDFVVENGGAERLHLIPCERVSDNVLGYFDTVGETFYEPYTGFTSAVSLGYDGSHYELETVGTPEVITLNGTHKSGLPSGYTLVNGLTNASSTKLMTGLADDTEDAAYEIRVKPSTGSWYIFQSRGSNESIRGLSGANTGNKIQASLSVAVASDISRDTSHTYFIRIWRKDGTTGIYVKDETTGETATNTDTYEDFTAGTAELGLWGQSQNTVASGNTIYEARLYKNGALVMDYVPCTYNGTAGFYDLVSRSFKTPDAGTVTAGSTVTDPILTAHTASAEDLLAVGTAADTQEIISGAVTRNIGVKVFDGTEQFGSSSAYGQAYYVTSASSAWGAAKALVSCTHFEGKAPAGSAEADGTCFFNASGHFYFRTDDYATATAFKEYLAAQYAAGTPVILLYPLATPTTESVDAQHLTTEAGTNTITVTAEVSGISLTCVYKGTASS